ncbi:DUF418 domain-containing protein [Erythrobacter arachoides]|uniref:DUF418 domain-containing protein n=1 Tax=Aurantiacibacter arachoides TaxID=1850444 RepID=A0A844ZX93_9SPHN|nr:DUF418 domain-containing protein [Aurantiacibacter arachoides]MXO92358.1 DUF418 domain-containing protein [Aurantiacibacter arachoides]GGD57802.1 hypothetical protein GCM10011411_17310 [Aurantiacibacter arachoides]
MTSDRIDPIPAPPPAAMPAPSPRPLAQGDRIAALDVVRGFAVLGILLANITAFAHMRAAYYWPPALPGGATASDAWLWLVQFVLVDGKMRGLFALLFGAGLALFAERAQGVRGMGLQARRLGWLALFGALHFVFLFDGDILLTYAVAGLLVLFVVRGEMNMLVLGSIWAVVGAVAMGASYLALALLEIRTGTMPPGDAWVQVQDAWQSRLAEYASQAQVHVSGSYADIVTMRLAELSAHVESSISIVLFETIPLMLIGIGLYRTGLFTDPATRQRWRKAAWIAVLAGCGVLLVTGLAVAVRGFPIFQTQFAFYGVAGIANIPVVVGAMVLLTDWAERARTSWLAERLGMAGRMAFSNYVGTSLVMMLIFDGWAGGRYGTMHRAELMAAVALGWALMLTFSRLWLARFRYGPLEWLWRCLTYWQVFPIRREHV